MTSNKNQPLPEGWVHTTIGSVTLPVEKVKPEENPEAQFTYLDISSIDNQAYKVVEPKVYLGAEAPSRARQLVKAHDVLFSTVRTYLRNIAMVPAAHDGEIASTGFSVLRGAPGIMPGYLYYYSLTDGFVDSLTELQRGTSYPAVRDSDVRSQEIPLAPTEEQRRIVDAIEAHFTRLDAAVKALQRAKANLEHYKGSVLQAACEGRLVPTEAELAREEGREYEAADVLLKRIVTERRARWEEGRWQYEMERARKKAAQAERKAKGLPYRIRDLEPEDWEDIPEEEYAPYLPKSEKWKRKYKEPEPPDPGELRELPQGWVGAYLETLASDHRHSISSGPFGSSLGTKDYQEAGIPVIRGQNIQNGEFVLDDWVYVSKEKASQLERSAARPGDLVVIAVGSSGRPAIVPDTLPEAILSQNINKISPDTGLVLPRYLVSAMQIGSIQEQLSAKTTDTVRKFLSLTNMRKTIIPLPPLVEQDRIVEEVDRQLSLVQALEAAIKDNLARSERLRQAILKRAFEGRLVPTEAELARQEGRDYEPADALLRRLRSGSQNMKHQSASAPKGEPEQMRLL